MPRHRTATWMAITKLDRSIWRFCSQTSEQPALERRVPAAFSDQTQPKRRGESRISSKSTGSSVRRVASSRLALASANTSLRRGTRHVSRPDNSPFVALQTLAGGVLAGAYVVGQSRYQDAASSSSDLRMRSTPTPARNPEEIRIAI